MTLPRRFLLAGLGITLAAPAIIRAPGLLMPVRSLSPLADMIERRWAQGATISHISGILEREIFLRNGIGSVIENCNLIYDKPVYALISIEASFDCEVRNCVVNAPSSEIGVQYLNV